MGQRTTDSAPDAEFPEAVHDRFAHLELSGDGSEAVIYDKKNPKAWVQSSFSADTADVR